MLTNERIAEIRERESKATKGPWEQFNYISYPGGLHRVRSRFDPSVTICECRRDYGHDAAFIAHARQDVPDLLAEVERLNDDDEKHRIAAHYWYEIVNTVPRSSIPMLWADVICHVKETYAEVERLRAENAEMRKAMIDSILDDIQQTRCGRCRKAAPELVDGMWWHHGHNACYAQAEWNRIAELEKQK